MKKLLIILFTILSISLAAGCSDDNSSGNANSNNQEQNGGSNNQNGGNTENPQPNPDGNGNGENGNNSNNDNGNNGNTENPQPNPDGNGNGGNSNNGNHDNGNNGNTGNGESGDNNQNNGSQQENINKIIDDFVGEYDVKYVRIGAYSYDQPADVHPYATINSQDYNNLIIDVLASTSDTLRWEMVALNPKEYIENSKPQKEGTDYEITIPSDSPDTEIKIGIKKKVSYKVNEGLNKQGEKISVVINNGKPLPLSASEVIVEVTGVKKDDIYGFVYDASEHKDIIISEIRIGDADSTVFTQTSIKTEKEKTIITYKINVGLNGPHSNFIFNIYDKQSNQLRTLGFMKLDYTNIPNK